MKIKSLLVLCSAVLLSVWGVQAADTKFADITHSELKQAISDKKVVLIDVNGSESYKSGHIPGAIDFEKTKDLAKLLPADKSSLIVAYCYGESCAAYRRAALEAQKLGYTNVKHYAAGITGWKAQQEKVETSS
jgi:rhodanese-related sulfurtransferase